MGSKKGTLIFVVTEDWYFYSHRRPMIKAAQEAGFDVAVITHVGKHGTAIEKLGVLVIPFSFERRSLNPFKALSQIVELARIYKKEKPVLVHHIAMKPILFGSIAALFARVPHIVNAFAGLGYVFNAKSALAVTLRSALTPPFFFLLRRKNSWLLFQNKDDRALLNKYGLVNDARARIIRGSGIDLNDYPLLPPKAPSPDFICVYAGRMIGIKGLPTLKEAFALLEKSAPHIKLKLYGKPDPENPGSWSTEQLRAWADQSPNVSYEGHADHMAAIWENAHAAIQASYGGEGVPKSLLEAAACGRAIVATDVPGCREVVEQGHNGFLVPPYDSAALAQALEKLANDLPAWRAFCANSRALVEGDMSSERVKEKTKELYLSCLR